MANILHTMGVRVNDHCGLHVHVDISDFTICQAAVLVARWIKAEYWMKQAVPKNRRRNKYCKFLTSKKKYDSSYQYTPEEFWYKIRPTNFCPHENAQKKVTLNMVNYAEFKAAGVYSTGRPTVELRLPEGTLNGQDIINWVVLFLYFVESSKKAAMPANMQQEIELKKALGFLGLNGTEPLQKSTQNWFLDRIIKFGQTTFVKKVIKYIDIEKEEKLDF